MSERDEKNFYTISESESYKRKATNNDLVVGEYKLS